MRSIVILFVMNLFVFSQNVFAVQNTQDCANRQIEDFKRSSNLTDSSLRRNAVLGYIKRNCNVDKEQASKLLAVYTSKKPVDITSSRTQVKNNPRSSARSAMVTRRNTKPSANGGTNDGLSATSSPSTTVAPTDTLGATSSPSTTSAPAAPADNSSGGGQSRGLSISGATDAEAKAAIMKCKSETNSIQSNNGTTTSRLSISEIYNCACLGTNFEETQTCKNLKKDAGIGKDDDDPDSCDGMKKAFQDAVKEGDELCGKGPNNGNCIQDYVDCNNGVLKSKDVYDSVNDKMIEAANLQALFKGGLESGKRPETVNKCNMLSGQDYFDKKDALERDKKQFEDDLNAAKEKILENRKQNSDDAKAIKDAIAELKNDYEKQKNDMTRDQKSEIDGMISQIAQLAKEKQETVNKIKNLELSMLRAQSEYNTKMTQLTTTGSKDLNCVSQMNQMKAELDKQKLGGNVGNSLNKKKALMAMFESCKKILNANLKTERDIYERQKDMMETQMANLNGDLASVSENSTKLQTQIEEAKVMHKSAQSTAQQAMMEKLYALSQQQQEQAARAAEQDANDKKRIESLEGQLRAKSLELMALGSPEPNNRKGEVNAQQIRNKIESAASKGDRFYQKCCIESDEKKNESKDLTCINLENGGEGYKAVKGKDGKKTVQPSAGKKNAK